MKKVSIARRMKFILVAFMVTIASHGIYAQDDNRLSFEFRPAVNFATADLGDASLKTGFGFEGTFAYRFMPHLSVYAGWGWNKFASDQSFAGANIDFEETGYSYGLQFIHPVGTSNIDFLLRAGALANHIEVENSDGDIIADSGHGFGFQLEGGISLPLGESWNLMPSIRYRSLSRDIDFGSTSTSVDLNYISVGVGIVKKF